MKKQASKSKLIVYSIILGICISALALLNIVLSAQVSNAGEKIKFHQQCADIIKKENQQLEAQLLDLGSLAYLEQEADKLGFTIKMEAQFITPDITIALNPQN